MASPIYSRRQRFLNLAGDRLAKLLAKYSPERQSKIMDWVESRLEDNSLLTGNPDRSTMRQWLTDVIEDNPNLMEQSVDWAMDRGTRPEKAETVEELILSLIPSEGGR
jgi:hypothetical protein